MSCACRRTEEPPVRGVLCPLPAAPLAYRATTPGGDDPTHTTLQVQSRAASRSRGTSRSDLIDSETDDEHFIVETDEYGAQRAPLRQRRERPALPDGAIVRCAYQSGQAHSTGNVGARQHRDLRRPEPSAAMTASGIRST